MFWQEDDPRTPGQIPDRIVDLLFSIECREIPVDHAHALSSELKRVLPDIADDGRFAVHIIHVAGSQNGWERPDQDPDGRLIVSRRTKLTLRVPKERADEVRERLKDATLDLDGCRLTLGGAKERPLSRQGTIFSRYVACEPGEDELPFLERMAEELQRQGIRVRKAICGKTTSMRTPEGPVHTRSVLLADLTPEEAVKLQETGLGPGRDMGLGVFLPHKGIEAVKTADDG